MIKIRVGVYIATGYDISIWYQCTDTYCWPSHSNQDMYRCTTETWSATKRNDVLSFTGEQLELQDTVLNNKGPAPHASFTVQTLNKRGRTWEQKHAVLWKIVEACIFSPLESFIMYEEWNMIISTPSFSLSNFASILPAPSCLPSPTFPSLTLSFSCSISKSN